MVRARFGAMGEEHRGQSLPKTQIFVISKIPPYLIFQIRELQKYIGTCKYYNNTWLGIISKSEIYINRT